MKRIKELLNEEHLTSETKKKVNLIKNILSILIIAFHVTLSSYLIIKSFDNKEIHKIYYSENNEIDYQVYLKENNFFETPFLPANKTYISSLIDYINIEFDYNMIYSEVLNGEYNYYINATILANKVGSDKDNYWSRTYNIVDNKKNKFKKQNNFSIKENIKIDYQYYNDLLTLFKKEYGLAINGFLKIELFVNSNIEHYEEVVNDKNILEVLIPLTQLSLDIEINTDSNESYKDPLVKIIKSNDIIYKIYFLLGILISIFSIALIVYFIWNYLNKRYRISKYQKEIKKILSTYDSIIVNINNFNGLSNYNVILVNTFEELIDAHREVRLPINYVEIEKDKRCMFILVKDNMAWVYRLESEYNL